MSYVSQQFLLHDSGSVANFKNWGQAISVALAAMGWIQTADTGQVNWSTISSVPGAGAFVYEIWEPADALQTGATAYFLRFEYGNTGAANAPTIRVSIAHSTDGAGTLQAPVSTVFQSQGTAGEGSTTVRECNFSGDIDRMSINMWRDSNSANSCSSFCIERTSDTAGVVTSEGVTIFASLINTNTGAQSTLIFSPLLVMSVGAFVHLYTNTTDLAQNNNVPVSPVFPLYLGKFGNPATGICLVPSADIANGGIFSTTLYGATRTFLASKTITFAGQAICIRFD